jgi:hypothetical protein
MIRVLRKPAAAEVVRQAYNTSLTDHLTPQGEGYWHNWGDARSAFGVDTP